jgi:hypothetical protein
MRYKNNITLRVTKSVWVFLKNYSVTNFLYGNTDTADAEKLRQDSETLQLNIPASSAASSNATLFRRLGNLP